MFLNNTFDFDVLEGEDSKTRLTLYVSDADYGENSALSFQTTGRDCGLFRVTAVRLDNHTVGTAILDPQSPSRSCDIALSHRQFELTVETVAEMDRENNSVPHIEPEGSAIYSCLVTAIDNGAVPLSTSRMVTIISIGNPTAVVIVCVTCRLNFVDYIQCPRCE